MKRSENRLFAGALVGLFVLGLFLQSCSSNTATPVSSSDVAVPLVNASNAGLTVPDFSFSSGDEVAELDPIGGKTGRDTTIKGGGRDTTVKGGPDDKGGNSGKGNVRMRPLPLPCLGLDSAQMMLIRQIMAEASSASKDAAEAYRASLAPIRSADSAAMAAYREATKGTQQALQEMQKAYRQKAAEILAQLRAGTLTREEAQKALQALKEQFAAESSVLRAELDAARKTLRAALAASEAQRRAANDAYQASLKRIQNDMNTKIAAILSPEQLRLWQIWLNGGDPCKGKGPRK